MNRVIRRLRRAYGRVFLRAAESLTPAIVVDHPDGVVLVPSDDVSIRPKLFLDGTRGDLAYLERAVSALEELGCDVAGTTFIDVGANLGTTSLAALRRHGFEHVVALEPHPGNARYLRATIALNGLQDAVDVVEAAVSDSAGRGAFAEGETRTGAGRLRPEVGGDGIEVEVVALDDLVARGVIAPGQVGLIWLDVQGWEGHALAGASRLLDASVPVVVALRRRQLKRTRGRDILLRIADERFSHMIDLRASRPEQPWSPELRPPAEMAKLLAGPRTTIDVLLVP